MALKARFLLVLKGAGFLVYGYCLMYTVAHHVINYVVLEGDSMYPTMNSQLGAKDVVLIEYWNVKRRQLKLNDIIIAKQPDKPEALICKRITALEGDRIHNTVAPCKYKTVPKGHVWLEGDNKRSSYDSRNFGPLPYALIHSRVFYRVWPRSKIGMIS